MGYRLVGAKQLSDTILADCLMDHLEHIFCDVLIKLRNFEKKCIWKFRLKMGAILSRLQCVKLQAHRPHIPDHILKEIIFILIQMSPNFIPKGRGHSAGIAWC